jgi:aminomuconate-semialdehyde/2-hydroxymuconate-6-semialdehyde dehydrogenase
MIIQNYINGVLQAPVNGKFIDNYEPATGKVYGQIPESDAADIQLAVDAANAAFPAWSQLGHMKRAAIMMKISEGILAALDAFAEAESLDNGKPVKLAKAVDIPRAVDNFHFFATAIEHFASESHFMEQTAINYTLRRPIGVVGCISPWNLPLYLFTWKIAPALAAGNCVVAKPSEITPLTSYLLSEVCIEAGLPAGVLNIVHGTGPSAGQAIIEHPEIKAISFTGGTATGKRIAATAAPMFKKLSLELGGKNPNIIFADCDFEQMLKTTMLSSFSNQGQICLCGSRILIERSIYDQFKNAFVEKVKALSIGDPKTDVNIGAVVSKAHQEKVLSYIELAKQEGGTILCGGTAFQPVDERIKKGYFIYPTVIEGLPQSARCNMEEIFGPVVTLQAFDTEEEALSIANATEYGLAATVWTTNLNRAHRVAEQLQSGIIWINCWLLRDLRTPFGGMKSSGVGREGGWEALRFFTEPKNVCVKYY